jgi:hypothetical protein
MSDPVYAIYADERECLEDLQKDGFDKIWPSTIVMLQKFVTDWENLCPEFKDRYDRNNRTNDGAALPL